MVNVWGTILTYHFYINSILFYKSMHNDIYVSDLIIIITRGSLLASLTIIKPQIVKQTETHITSPQIEIWSGGTQPKLNPEIAYSFGWGYVGMSFFPLIQRYFRADLQMLSGTF